MAEVIAHFRLISHDSRALLLKILEEEHVSEGGVYEEIRKEYVAGDRRDKIRAIKQVREVSRGPSGGLPTLSLKEAKDIVDQW
jgi:ribosomal protein L7/L12